MKFLPEFFKTETGIDKFANFLRTFVDLEMPHIQFNVVRKEDLLAAKKNPEQYRGLTVDVYKRQSCKSEIWISDP